MLDLEQMLAEVSLLHLNNPNSWLASIISILQTNEMKPGPGRQLSAFAANLDDPSLMPGHHT